MAHTLQANGSPRGGRKGRILCFTSYYLPGFKSGGPLRSLLHLQEWLGGEYEFAVLTRNRDLGDAETYAGLSAGTWYPVGGVRVCYLSAPQWRPDPIRTAVREFDPDLLYFNSSVDFSLTAVPLLLRHFGWLPGRILARIPVLVAPRGEFSPGARSIKPLRKKAYFLLGRLLGLYRDITWQATKDEEAAQIRGLWGSDARVVVAPNLPSRVSVDELPVRKAKQPGALRLVFLSRISRMKNLHGALGMLGGITVPVTLDVYGTREDPQYWDECRQLMERLPRNVEATYRGAVAPEAVISTLSKYDAFFLPTLGENFGHVIHEALLAGCPVLLSDQTPWQQLSQRRVGFDISLDRPELFQQAIGQLAAMDGREHQRWSAAARDFGVQYSADTGLVQSTRSMLGGAMS